MWCMKFQCLVLFQKLARQMKRIFSQVMMTSWSDHWLLKQNTLLSPHSKMNTHFTYGYKLVGDNVDKNVKPSLQRFEMRSQSLHYFHSFAVRDCVPIEALSHSSPVHSAITIAPIPTPDPQKLLPTPDDMHYIKDEMCILLSR